MSFVGNFHPRMHDTEFEAKLVERYGDGPIPKEDIKGILEEAVESNVIEREEIGDYSECKEYGVSELLRLTRKWRTGFLKDSFSINDIFSCESDAARLEDRCSVIDEQKNGNSICNKDSFVTTDDAFLSSLREKTKIITERGVNNSRKTVTSVLKAWEQYDKLPVNVSKRPWYYSLMLFFPILLYFLYSEKPF